MATDLATIPVVRSKRRAWKEDYTVTLKDRDFHKLLCWLRELAIKSECFDDVAEAVRIFNTINPQLKGQGFYNA